MSVLIEAEGMSPSFGSVRDVTVLRRPPGSAGRNRQE